MKNLLEEQLTFVMQGPIVSQPRFLDSATTKESILSIKYFFPKSSIILSTYEDSDLSTIPLHLLSEIVLNRHPDCAFFPGSQRENNLNRLLVSSHAGLTRVSTAYACKTRTDISFTSNSLLSHLKETLESYPLRDSQFSILRSRVLIPTLFTVDPKKVLPIIFNFSDLLIAGNTEDVQYLFDIPLASEPTHTRYFTFYPTKKRRWWPSSFQQFHAEQYIWITAIRKTHTICCTHQFDLSKGIKALSDKFLVNNCLVQDGERLGINLPFTVSKEKIETELVSHKEWRELYQRYCDPHPFSSKREPLLKRIKYRYMFLKFQARAVRDFYRYVYPNLKKE